jgi:hypothetical protein
MQYLTEDRRHPVSPYGAGNPKLGPGVFTYSLLPGREHTCPGSTAECEAICYAKRIGGLARELYRLNTERGDVVPPVPDEAKLVRWHVSGDFHSHLYVLNWITRVEERPDVTFWGYTRSWRATSIPPHALNALRDMPNVHLWASVDSSMGVVPGDQWNRAWIEGDPRLTKINDAMYRTFDGRLALVCPEERGSLPNCVTCGYCFHAMAKDLVFLRH